MNGRFLLDTNIVVALRAEEAVVRARIDAPNVETFIPGVVIGELYYGAYKSAKVEFNLNWIAQFVAMQKILHSDNATTQHYGQIKNQLRQKGQPIPENDLWIAALVIQHNFTLATRDKHFTNIRGLSLELW